ncbi:MAG: DUF3887 domain-containing protein [Chitinophagaceae bacterium]|nr:MAG: DUF3887 domain-containing protein [Chitinophagaceae bacterium]
MFLVTGAASSVFGQPERVSYKMVSRQFEQHYNNHNYDSIFFMFSEETKKALPLEKTIEFLSGLNAQVGKIKQREFLKYENGTFAAYKTSFERGLFTVNISLDNSSKINGLFVKPFTDISLPKMERNTTKLILPFKDEWTVFWGGDKLALNYHVDHVAQKNAFDFLITNEKGKSFKTNGSTNEDYYAFGKEIIAPCDAEVVLVVEGIKDNKPGDLNPIYVPGNTIILKTAANEYLLFAHFKQHSIVVKQGQKIKQGTVLGLCGNSGNSSEPHLHFHIQNVENMNIATGVKCYFDKIMVNGEIKSDHSPIKNEKIKN